MSVDRKPGPEHLREGQSTLAAEQVRLGLRDPMVAFVLPAIRRTVDLMLACMDITMMELPLFSRVLLQVSQRTRAWVA